MSELDDYLDIKSFLTRYPQFKEGQIRWLVVRRHEIGLAPAIKKVGRRLYFHIPTFLDWLKNQDV